MYGLKDRYDMVMGLGGSCSVVMGLRAAGMQFAAFPLDWAGGYHLETNAGALLDGFRNFFVPGLRFLSKSDSTPHDVYVNDSNGIVFYHDVPEGVALSKVYDEISLKYRKRQQRCQELLSKAKSILFVYVELGNKRGYNPDGKLIAVHGALAAAYPNAEVDLLFFHHRDGKDFRSDDVVELRPHLFKMACDLVSDGNPANLLFDEPLFIERMRRLVPNGAVDYRTPAEIKAFAVHQRMKKWERMHAHGWLEYFRNRLYYKLFRHFENKLRKAGIINERRSSEEG